MTTRRRSDVSMAAFSTYRVGGTVTSLTVCGSEQELLDTMKDLGARSSSVLVVGNGSNLLVADGTVDVDVIHLGGDFTESTWRDEGDVVVAACGAGADLPVLARRLVADGVRGFEWAVGVPGTIGGAVAMNAGGHGSDMAAAVVSVRLFRDGAIIELAAAELAFGYRHSVIRAGDVVLSATLHLTRGDEAEGREMLSEIVRWRRAHQPGGANAGSVFRNPPNDSAGRLLEAVGMKGVTHGGAEVSSKHANFIIAGEGARAADVLALMREGRRRVEQEFGITLVAETRLVGCEEQL